jgi:hypothetical protein
MVGNGMWLTKCTMNSMWMYGSDHNLFDGEEQFKMSQKPGYWTNDKLITGIDAVPRWRNREGYCMAAWRAGTGDDDSTELE